MNIPKIICRILLTLNGIWIAIFSIHIAIANEIPEPREIGVVVLQFLAVMFLLSVKFND